MSRKIIIISTIFVIVGLFTSICFANTENMMDAVKNTTVDLKDEITKSIDKTEKVIYNGIKSRASCDTACNVS